MQGALDLAVAEAARRGATEIHCVTMRIGALANVVPDALEFAFEVLRADTAAANARLVVEWVPTVCYCAACEKAFQPEGMIFQCPDCGQFSADIRSGRELAMVSLEVS